MFGQSLLSGAFGTALVPGENFGINLYTGTGANQIIGGKFEGAGSFNGSSSNIELPSLLPVNSAASSSASCWFNTTYAGAEMGTILNSYNAWGGGTSSTPGWTIFTEGNANFLRLGSYYLDGSNVVGTDGTTNVSDGTWHFIVVVFDSSANTLNCYLDGNSSPEISITGLTSSSVDIFTENATIGYQKNPVGSNRYFNGSIDQVRIFNTALTTSQITSLYAETASDASTLNFPAGAGCVAAYQLDTTANTVLSQADLSTCNFPTGAGCQALYQFNNTSNDTCGNYNLTEVGSPSYVTGPFGKAIQFNGTSQGVTSTSAIIPNSAATISLWYNGNGTSTAEFYIIGVGVGSGSTGLDIHYYNGNFYGGLVDAGTFKGVGTGSTSIDTSRWYHLALTWDGSTSANSMKLYINGILETNITPTVAASSLTYSSFGIGKTSTATYAPGIVDQVRIFDTALSASQITELARGEPKYNATPSSVSFNGWLGFKPDLTWIKKRNGGTGNNLLQNTVNGTGTGSSLSSNSTASVGNFDQYGYLSSFDEQGFTTQGGSSGSYPYDNLGESGSGYVSWNWKAGADTYAGYFNGTSTKITTDYTTNDSEFSVSVWSYPRVDPGSVYLYHANKGYYTNSSNTNYWSLQNYAAAAPSFQVRLNSTAIYATSSVSMVAGKWYHLVGTCDSSGNLKIYVNGTETGSASGAPARSMGQAIIFGQYMDGSWASGYYKGEMNQIRYFNQAISASEVTSLYNEGLSDNNTLDFPTGAGCTSAWPLNGSPDPLSGSSMGSTPVDLKFVKSGYTGKNNNGTIESQISANPDYGFSIVKWVGNGTSGATIAHGLSKIPELMFVKGTSATSDWDVYHVGTGATKYSILDTDQAVLTATSIWNDTAPTSTVFSVGNHSSVNSTGASYIAYCWHSVPKYSKIGSYTGDGNTSGHIITTGFEPSWIMFKPTSATGYWYILDNKRSTVNPRNDGLFPNDSSAEIESTNYNVDFLSTGFELKNNTIGFNQSGTDYIYVAFA